MVAVGVDTHGEDQRQWWFCGGEGRRRAEIVRWNRSRDATELSQRSVTHAGYTLLGFVCEETYEWSERELAQSLLPFDYPPPSSHSVNASAAASTALRRSRALLSRDSRPAAQLGDDSREVAERAVGVGLR